MNLGENTVIDQYCVEACIGQGGMARVYRVRHMDLGTRHALKVLAIPEARVTERLLQEGRFQASLRHQNIVAVTDTVRVGGAPGLVMEYVSGPSLHTLLATHRLSLEDADALAVGILRGVAAAHRAGMIHRDLKPANVLLQLTDEGVTPKVADFGLAKLVHGSRGMTVTRSGVSLGTPNYMAPEQMRDAKRVTMAADMFSLGALLYAMYCGIEAFPGDDAFAAMELITSGVYEPPRTHAPELPERVETAIVHALQLSIADRTPDCDTMLAELTGNAEGRWPPAQGSGLVQHMEALGSQLPSIAEAPANPNLTLDGLAMASPATRTASRLMIAIAAVCIVGSLLVVLAAIFIVVAIGLGLST